MKNELSGIWKQVLHGQTCSTSGDPEYETLTETAKFVIDCSKTEYAFRRNRELVDLGCRFRFFSFQGKNYIIKKAKPHQIPLEYLNALRMEKEIQKLGLKHIHVVIPQIICSDTDGTIGLLQEDHGFTLYEDIEQTREQIKLDEMMNLFGNLLNHGIEWSGWLPRNMFWDKGELWLIDFEDVRFHNIGDISVSDLTLFKITLGWGQIYEKTAVSTALEKAIKNIRISTEHLDSFERALAGLLDNKKNHQVRQIGFNITYLSELPLKKQLLEKTYFSSMDTGHLLEDVFDDDYLSVWYTIGTAKIRREYGDEIYADFLRSFEHALVILLSESEKKEQRVPILPLLRKLALCLIIRFFNLPDGNMYEAVSQSKDTMMIFRVLAESCPCIASVLNFKQLQFKRGWEAASTRSKHMHRFLYEIFSILVWSIPSLSTCSLLLRGSCAQGVMSIYSDVDFEISNEEYPIGFLPAEELLSGILRVLGIEHEGSTARPTEIDLVSSNGNTRDLHEWMELTVPDSSTPNKGWVNGMFSIDPAWRFYSEYESQKHHLTPKYLFFRIRAIIERLSLQYGINKVSIVEKLQELCSITDFADGKMLLQMTKRCLNCYESPTIDFDELIELNRYIETLYAQMRIRYHG